MNNNTPTESPEPLDELDLMRAQILVLKSRVRILEHDNAALRANPLSARSVDGALKRLRDRHPKAYEDCFGAGRQKRLKANESAGKAPFGRAMADEVLKHILSSGVTTAKAISRKLQIDVQYARTITKHWIKEGRIKYIRGQGGQGGRPGLYSAPELDIERLVHPWQLPLGALVFASLKADGWMKIDAISLAIWGQVPPRHSTQIQNLRRELRALVRTGKVESIGRRYRSIKYESRK